MAFTVKPIGDMFRLIDSSTGTIAVRSDTGRPIDGGGHDFKKKADNQAGHMNEWLEKQEESDD